MIYDSVRYKDGEQFRLGTTTKTTEDAIVSLFEYELGYGGIISVLDDNYVQTTTYVLGCRDVTTFSFTDEKEKEATYELLQIWNMVVNDGNPSAAEVDSVMKITKGNPLMIKIGSGLIMGRSRLEKMKYGMILSTMVEEQESTIINFLSEQKAAINKTKFQDVVTAWLMIKNGTPFSQAMALLLATPVYDDAGKIKGISLAV